MPIVVGNAQWTRADQGTCYCPGCGSASIWIEKAFEGGDRGPWHICSECGRRHRVQFGLTEVNLSKPVLEDLGKIRAMEDQL